MFKIESYLSPFLLNWLNSYVKLKNEDFKLSLWEGDAVFNKLDLRLEVFQDLLRLPFNIRSGRIQQLRIHVPWTRLGSEPVCLTVDTIEFVLSLPDEEKSSSSQKNVPSETLSTDFERTAEFIQQAPASVQQAKQPSYLENLVFKIINNIQINVNNLIVKYIEGDMIVSINVKSAESWSAADDWSKSFVDVLPPNYGLRKVASMHDATICLDRCTPSGKIETYNEPFMYRCSLQCRMLFEYNNPHARVPCATKLAFFFGEPEFSIADTQLPLLLRLIRTGLTIAYGNTAEVPRASLAVVEKRLSSSTLPIADESSTVPPGENGSDENPGWSNWAMSYLPGVTSWTTGFQAPLILPPDASMGEVHSSKPAFTFVGVYAKRLTLSLKLSKKHVDPLGTSSRIQFHPCLSIVASDVKTELAWRGDAFFSCSVIVNSLVGKTAGFCTCHVRDEGEQVISCGQQSPTPLPVLFDQILTDTDEIPNDADEHLAKYSDEHISEMQPAFMMDFITDSDKSREKPNAPLDELRRFQRAIFRWFVFNPTISLTGGLFHRITKFLGHAQKSEFDLFSSVRIDDTDSKPLERKMLSNLFVSTPDVTSLDFNVCGRSDKVFIRNITIFAALNNHPCALPGKHSGIFAQRLSQIGSPLRLCAGNIVVAKAEPLYPKEIGAALRAYAGPLSEELISPCCAQYVMECSNISLDLPSAESGATFAIACGLSFSITAKNYAVLDSAVLRSANLPADFVSFTMPDIQLTFNYSCLLYCSLVLSSYTAFDGRHSQATTTGIVSSSATAIPQFASGFELMTTTLLGMVYAPRQEAFTFSAGNVSLHRADFANIHYASETVSCFSAVLSFLRLDLVSDTGQRTPIATFMQSDVPSAAIFIQWEPLKFSVDYVLATFSPLAINFSNQLNTILAAIDLNRYLKATDANKTPNFAGEHQGNSQQQGQYQSAFRLLADLLASETVSTSKPATREVKSQMTKALESIRESVINFHIGSVKISLLDQLVMEIPRTSVSTPSGFKRLFTRQLFNLSEPLECAREEAMLWTIKLEQISLRFKSQQIFNTPLTIWATLSAMHGSEESSLAKIEKSNKLPAMLSQQLSLHVNIENIAITMHRPHLRNLFQLQATLMQTFCLVSSQMTVLQLSPPSNGEASPQSEMIAVESSQVVQLWLQITVPRSELTLYLDDENQNNHRLCLTLETLALSVDSHPLYRKIRFKFQSLHGEAEQRTVDSDSSLVTWVQDKSFFYLSNSQLFELNSCHQLATQVEMSEDESKAYVGDEFVVTITTAKIRDVFLHIHESLQHMRDPIFARSTSGEPFSPGRANSPSGAGTTGSTGSGITEICILMPNVDFVMSQDALNLFGNIAAICTENAAVVATEPLAIHQNEFSVPAVYMNSGVIRTFFNVCNCATQPSCLDFVLVCCRLAITSDLDVMRSRRQTACLDTSLTGGAANTTRSSIGLGHNGGAACENQIHISLEQLSAYTGSWSSLSQSATTAPLSPHLMNNPALHWNLKASDVTSSEKMHLAFFPLLTNPVDINISSSSSALEVIVRQPVEVRLILGIVAPLVSWIGTVTKLMATENVPENSSSESNKVFDVTVLCPDLTVYTVSLQDTFLPQVKVNFSRPQLLNRVSEVSSLKITCHGIVGSVMAGPEEAEFKAVEIAKESTTFFAPVALFSTKSSQSTIAVYETAHIYLNAQVIKVLAEIFEEIQKVLFDIYLVTKNYCETPSVDSEIVTKQSQLNIVTDRVVTNYHSSEKNWQLSSSFISLNSHQVFGTPYCTRSRLAMRTENLTSFLLNSAVGYDHCILQPADFDLAVDLSLFKVSKGKSDNVLKELQQSVFVLSTTPIFLSITNDCIAIGMEVTKTLLEVSAGICSTNSYSVADKRPDNKISDLHFTSHDDLRNEAVHYSFVSDSLVAACQSEAIPVNFANPEQVFIATDGLLWSYTEPRFVTKLQLSPLPFTVQGDQEVICVLQRLNNVSARFEPVVSFRVPTEKSLSLLVEQNYPPTTAYRMLLKQPVAPPSESDKPAGSAVAGEADAVPPPATLAACCCVDSQFASKITPTVTSLVSVPKLEITLARCFPSVTPAVEECLPFPSHSVHLKYPPNRLAVANVTDVSLKATNVPETGFSSSLRFSAKMSCQDPRDLSYRDILDGSAHFHFKVNKNAVSLDGDWSRLNLLVNETLLRNLYHSFENLMDLIIEKNPSSEFSFQLPTAFICNLTSDDLVIYDLDPNMPAPDMKVASHCCMPFQLHSVYLSSKAWPAPLSITNWRTRVCEKVVRVMPNASHAVIISKHNLPVEGDNPITLLTLSSCLVVANCLNVALSVTYGDRPAVISPLSICSTDSAFVLKEDMLSISLATTDGFWVSTSPVKLRLKSGMFAFMSMKNAMAEESEADNQANDYNRKSMFTVVVSLIVEKIESFYHVLLLILPPFVLDTDFPDAINATLTNPHRGKVACSISKESCPYPFCDIVQNEMVHLAPSVVSQTDEEWTYHSGPVTFSLESLAAMKDHTQKSLPSIDAALLAIAKWIKSVTTNPAKPDRDKKTAALGAAIYLMSSRLFPFAPTLSVRCVPGVKIVNNTTLPLVLMNADGSALSLASKSTLCAPQLNGGIKLCYFDANVLWQSKPIDILSDRLIDVATEAAANAEDTEAEYRASFFADRVVLAPNRSCRFGIVITSQNVECLLVLSSCIDRNDFDEKSQQPTVLTINTFLSALNKSHLINRIACYNQPPSASSIPSFQADYALQPEAGLQELPFVSLSAPTTQSNYMDSVYFFFGQANSPARLWFNFVPFRYLTAISSEGFMGSVAISVSPADDNDWQNNKRLVIVTSDNPFHDVTIRNSCEFDIHIREKPVKHEDLGALSPIFDDSSSFRIPPGFRLELAYRLPTATAVQFGVNTSDTDIVWSEEMQLPSLLCPQSPSINNGGINIVSFGHRSVCDLQLTIDSYCDTIPEVVVKTLIKALVTKHEKKNVVVQPATVVRPLSTSSSKEDFQLSRRSSVASRAHSPANSVLSHNSNTTAHRRTRSFFCRFDHFQVLLTDEELTTPRFVLTLEGLSVGASVFGGRGDEGREPTGGTYQCTARSVQIDNFIDHGSKAAGITFPVILLSSASNDTSHCFRVHGSLLSRIGSTIFSTLSLSPGNFSMFVEDTNIHNFVDILSGIGAVFEQTESSSSTNRAPMISYPLPLRSFFVDTCSIELTLRASLYVYIAANQTPLNFSVFRLSETSVTWSELIHKLATFYVRGAIFRAGLLVGSLNIIGRPLSLVRTTTYAVRDICFSPFSGRGVLQTASSAAHNVVADAILSVADFAESVGRNVDQISSRPPLSPAQQPESFFDGLKQGFTALGISVVGAIGGLAGRPIEEVLTALEAPGQILESATSPPPSSSLTSFARISAAATRGVGLGLVGLVAQPMAGLSAFVADTGHGLLNSVGMPNMPRIAEMQPFFRHDVHEDSINVWFRVEDTLASVRFAGGHIVSLLKTSNPHICILLCRRTVSLFSLSERILQQTFFISDIEMDVDKQEDADKEVVLRIYRKQPPSPSNAQNPSNPSSCYDVEEMELNKWRVEAYLASSSTTHQHSNQSPPMFSLYSLLKSSSSQPVVSSHQNAIPLCSIGLSKSHSAESVKRFLNIFYYLRDVCSSSLLDVKK